MKLTICLPSYNRLEAAKRCVTKLLKIATGPQVTVKVIDNGSDSNYEEEFSKIELFGRAMTAGSLSIIRNSNNIGMGANFMRCFEVADGDWLWMVADDDDIRSDAIEAIVTAIDTYADDCGLIVFGSEAPKHLNQIVRLQSIESFIDFNHAAYEVFNRFIFLTNSIYDLRCFRPLVSVGYQNVNTYIPHFMMQVAYMQRGGTCVSIQKKIVDYVVPTLGYSYSMVAGLGVGAPKHVHMKTDERHYKKFLSLFFPHNDYKVVIDLYYICKRDSSPFVCRHLAKSYISYVKDARKPLHMLGLRSAALLLLHPKLFECAIGLLTRVSPKIGKHVTEIQARYHQ